ncbi:DUF7619 domain-containing protein [Flavobacterium nitrogenifigens]|uniref:Por secretion system C-terminal sorting domain-containing protein n=1 Tax=Flavobacterium nitrogenifigens TaxID=1617283 RepID=A0A521BPG9_9FLAO|nr:T9SS type A sorting domain-containing protein [Flavobacterium nitrogenifigens]SMO48965.1 Por secretion system C-terminal sorting domain-containing protein [Flavobacterium nitrogenifigens]
MVKNYLLLLLFLLFSFANAQVISIPDAKFKATLLMSDQYNSVAKDLSGQPIKIDKNNNGAIEVSEALNVSHLDVSNSQITSLQGISNFSNLVDFYCQGNQLIGLDLNLLKKLKIINASGNSITSLAINELIDLESFNCSNNRISILNLDGFTKLTTLSCSSNVLTKLSVANCESLTTLDFVYNPLTEMNVSGCKTLVSLYCNGLQLEKLNVSGCLSLTILNCSSNKLSNLNLEGLNKLEGIYCANNQIKNLNVSNLPALQIIDCHYNEMESLIAVNCISLKQLNFIVNPVATLNLSGCKSLTSFSCSNGRITNLNMSDCSALTDLDCGNNDISLINLNGLDNLLTLSCYNNNLSNLDISNLSKLETLACSGNNLTSLDFSKSLNLKAVDLDGNYFASLEIKNLPKLETFDCTYSTQLTKLEMSNLPKLKYLYCYKSKIETLSLDNIPELFGLYCEDNQIRELNLSQYLNLDRIYISNNPIEFLNLKNGKKASEFRASNLSLVKYACVDDFEIDNIKYELNSAKYEINTYCSFTPGGKFYTIQGSQKFDLDNQGCANSNVSYPNLSFSISDGINKGNIISDTSGNYAIAVGEGTHTVKPIIENLNYFTVSPEFLTVNFPAETSSLTQNFCVLPKEDHQDIEISMLSILPARPGFDANYKIVYKNKANKTVSGAITLDFNNAVLDYVSSIPAIASQTSDKLIWHYTDLKAFETREIELILNVNSPTETPSVNVDDRLSFNVLITPVSGDEKPTDNSFAMRQTVVGSFDPNDKTCLEGDVIKPELIGEYVHYLIRFENTGSYLAENIVVKDLIDLSKFDISTLVPTSSSHKYVTKISDGNKVEFIFEKINLPFDDANNNGYVAFKIKTLPTLVVGDSFENEANIYFDYNFPILTNKETSTFKTLGQKDFGISSHFNIHPNPVRNYLQIESKDLIDIESIYIYNILGQLIQVIPNAHNTSKIDVTKFQSGNYILKIKTSSGDSIMKFVKI